MKTTTINFVDNATTKEAGIYAMKYGCIREGRVP